MSECSNVLSVLRYFAKIKGSETLLMTDKGAQLGYARFLTASLHLAKELRRLGLDVGGVVAIQAEDSSVMYCSMFGAWLAGGVAMPLNLRATAASLQETFNRVRPTCVVVQGPAVIDFGNSEVIFCEPERIFQNFSCQDTGYTPADESTALILFTSGTTGISKGVQLSWRSINFNVFSTAKALNLREDDCIFVNTPSYYTSGICHFLTLLCAGGSMVHSSGFHFGEELFHGMLKMGCTGFGGAPAHIVRAVLPYVQTPARLTPVPRLRFWVSSGDHLASAVLTAAKQLLPHTDFFVMYGLTEVSGRLCVLPPAEQNTRPGSVGQPLSGMTITICDERGVALPVGHSGEICVRGPGLMSGYYKAPDIDARSFGHYGFRSGDMGRLDPQGFLWVEGRIDDIFKSGGEKVSLQALQQALLKIDGVLDCAAIPEDNEILGKIPLAFVVPDADNMPSRLDILKQLRLSLSAANLPRRIVFTDTIPRTGSGKAIRAELLVLGKSKANP